MTAADVPPTPDLAALAEEVLAAHVLLNLDSPNGSACVCGWKWDPRSYFGRAGRATEHRYHVAAVLVSRLGPVLDGVRAEALRQAAKNADHESILAERRSDVKAENFWYACRDYLAARADAAARPETTEGER